MTRGVPPDNLIDFTPELKAEALKMASEYRMGPLFSPPMIAGTNGYKGYLHLPAVAGGANWQGGAADTETGVLYVASGTFLSAFALIKDPERSDMDYIATGTAQPPSVVWATASRICRGPGQRRWSRAPAAARALPDENARVFGPQGLPMVKPPWDRIEDPKVFSRPWTMNMAFYRHKEPNFQLLDYECYSFELDKDPIVPPSTKQ